MAKQGSTYETLVQRVFSQILAQSAVKTIDVRKNVVVQGKTTRHEIDVFWEFELSGIKYKTIIQAKDWATKVPQGEILKLKAVLDDIPGQPKGIFVTRTGYQPGAEQFALANGIGLYEFREPNEADWQGKLKEININLRMFVPNTELTRFEFDEVWIRDRMKQLGIPHLALTIRESPDRVWIFDDHGRELQTMQQVLDELLASMGMKETAPQEVRVDLTGKERFLLSGHADLKFLKLKCLVFRISIAKIEQPLTIDYTSVVGFILRNVAAGKEIVFDKNLTPRGRATL